MSPWMDEITARVPGTSIDSTVYVALQDNYWKPSVVPKRSLTAMKPSDGLVARPVMVHTTISSE